MESKKVQLPVTVDLNRLERVKQELAQVQFCLLEAQDALQAGKYDEAKSYVNAMEIPLDGMLLDLIALYKQAEESLGRPIYSNLENNLKEKR